MNATKVLIVLLAIAIVLGIVAFFAVFSPGTYEFGSSSSTSNSSGTLSFNSLANDTSTTSSSTATSTTSTSTFVGSTVPGTFQTNYTYPYVENWTEGQNDFSITGASFDGSHLTLSLKIQIGNVGGCIPVNLRLVTDETGDVMAPTQSQFNFPDTNSCNATPNATYQSQQLIFPISGNTPTPWLLDTGGTSNQFFQVSTSTDGGLPIQLPATSG